MPTWPTPQDYNEAVQNPALNFSDEELKNGVVELDALGLPRPVSGAFATVYKFQCADRTLAVRCFLRQVKDQEDRYRKISDFVSNDNLPYTVHFQYLPRGIKIRGNWYPILKMEWVEGRLLNEYIEENFQDPEKMSALSRNFLEMHRALSNSGVAHGDFQHGNIIVVGGALRLVDYDGMFVPALEARPSLELGHRNYQHPGRDETHFGAYLDNFSSWVISVSMHAIAEDAELWRKFEGGDERLLMGRADLVEPAASRVLSIMEHHASPTVKEGAKTIRYLLAKEPPDVPPPWEPPVIPAHFPALPEWTAKPEWLQSQLSAGALEATSLWSESFAQERETALKERSKIRLVATPAAQSSVPAPNPGTANRFAALAPVATAGTQRPAAAQTVVTPPAAPAAPVSLPNQILRVVSMLWIIVFITVGANAAFARDPAFSPHLVFFIAILAGILIAANTSSKKASLPVSPPQSLPTAAPSVSLATTAYYLGASFLISGVIHSIVAHLVPIHGIYPMTGLIYLVIVSILLREWDLLARYQSKWLSVDFEMLRTRGRGILIVGGLVFWILFHKISVMSALLMFFCYRHLIAEYRKRSGGSGNP